MQKTGSAFEYKKLIMLISVSTLLFSYSFKNPNQLFSTSLHVTVRNELGNTEDNVLVTLFKSKDDYTKSANSIAASRTDNKGKTIFKNLEPNVYYIKAEKAQADNAGGGEQTAQLEANKINRITIVISE